MLTGPDTWGRCPVCLLPVPCSAAESGWVSDWDAAAARGACGEEAAGASSAHASFCQTPAPWQVHRIWLVEKVPTRDLRCTSTHQVSSAERILKQACAKRLFTANVCRVAHRQGHQLARPGGKHAVQAGPPQPLRR